MTFAIHASKNGQSVVTIRISPAIAVDKARVLESLGWQVHVTDSAGHQFYPSDFDRLSSLARESAYASDSIGVAGQVARIPCSAAVSAATSDIAHDCAMAAMGSRTAGARGAVGRRAASSTASLIHLRGVIIKSLGDAWSMSALQRITDSSQTSRQVRKVP
jgi:hypothetical protein